MKIALKYLFHSCLILMTASIFGCVNAPIKPTADEVKLFTDASPMIGQKVVIRGYLHYEFENMNLFPTDSAKSDFLQKLCLPVLIQNKKKDILETAHKLNRSLVTVSGTIVNAADPGMVSVTTCKQVGIDVDSINRL